MGSRQARSASPVFLVLVVLVTLAVHAPALRTGYVYDDVEAILENPDLRSWDSAPSLFFVNYWGEDRNIGLYRPLVQLTYLIDGAGFDFASPRVSHLVNLVLHLGTVLLLFLLLVRLGLASGVAALATLLFGVHPALLDASVWISGRTDVMAGLFVVAGLIMASKAEERNENWSQGGYTAALGLCYLLGLFSKEMAVTLPLLVLLLPGRHAARLPTLGAALGIYVVFRSLAVDGVIPSGAGSEGVLLEGRDLLERLALGLRACARLLAMVVVPLGLAGDHRGHPWAAPDAEVGLTGGAAFLLYPWLLYLVWRRRRRDPVGAFLWGGVLVSLLPILQIIPIGAVMAERFNYVPALFLVPALLRMLHGWIPTEPLRRALALMAVIVAVTITWVRIPIYETRAAYCKDVLRAYPGDHKAWNNFGVSLYLPMEEFGEGEPDYVRADAAFECALAARPGYRKGALNRARALLERQLRHPRTHLSPIEGWLGGPADRGDPDALYLLGKVSLRGAEQLDDPVDQREYRDLAWKRFVAAAEGYAARDAVARRTSAAWKMAGLAARELGRQGDMVEAWSRALATDPTIEGADAMRRAIE